MKRRCRFLSTTALGAITVGALAISACGVPSQDSFDVIDDKTFDVDPPSVTSTTSAGTVTTAMLPVRPYFVAEEGIRPLPEELGTYEAIVAALQARPEDGSGLRTAISAETVVDIRPDGAAVVIELTEAFQSLPPEEQRLAAAQLVLTVTDRSPGLQVSFALAGEPVDVPTADNSVSVGGAVSRADYSSLLAQK